ncbi:MAG: type I restriction endonuclease subunit R [Acidobacteria bacterium]|nr:type I restriction endonuclease subunit R [Acidobacteriota bacterium]
MSYATSEDVLVQQTTADYFHDELGWDSVYAFDKETFGSDGTLGRASKKEIVLTRYLRKALEELNPGLPAIAYETAIKTVTETSVSKSPLQINREKYHLLKNGVLVKFRNNEGDLEEKTLNIFNFADATKNNFLVVRELWVHGDLYHRRPDIIGFVNGIPLLFIELKNVHKDIRHAYDDNFTDYKDTIPHIFDHNAFIVLSNGDQAKLGSLSSKYEHFHEWKRLEEEDAGSVDFETLLKGMCSKQNFMDLFENFILFDETTGKVAKIVARNHQFLGVNRAIESVRNRENLGGQLGVFWHTQGSGKSYSMAFFSEKIRRKLTGNFTFLVVTDRDDLDAQIYKTFAGCGIVDNKKDKCRATSGDNLEEILKADKPYVFTMVHKFNKRVDPAHPYSDRNDIIVMSDEAHRTQYGLLAQNMRDALPYAHFIGFTGTPLFKDDEVTKRIFGGYISKYNFQRAVEDNATVPLFYDNRGEKLKVTTTEINEKIAAKIEQAELKSEQKESLERELGKDYRVFTAEKRLKAIARDFVEHYTTQWESGKAMFVCIDKITTARMLNYIQPLWAQKIKETEVAMSKAADEQEEIQIRKKLEWLQTTQMAIVISEEQNEVQKFATWGIDIKPHREIIKNGFETIGGKRVDVDAAFKDDEHPFRVALVCAMWLTGFDVPSLATLYLDKPLKAHTLMQAIARANRVHEGKNNGLVVDYCGILKNLRKALATFATGKEKAAEDEMPTKPSEELLIDLAHSIDLVKSNLAADGCRLEDLTEKTGFPLIAALKQAKEVVNQNDETRKRFEVSAREVYKKFKACVNIKESRRYQKSFDAIDLIYKKLQDDRKKADISQILKELHDIVDEAIVTAPEIEAGDAGKIYDISKIDFDRLQEEFQRSTKKNTTVQSIKEVVENRVRRMLAKNPLRVNLYNRYQEIIAEYNKEKDRVTIEQTFESLLKFIALLDEEETRAMREGLEEESLALFDLLLKPTLTTQERNRLKEVAKDLLSKLKTELLNVHNWREKESTKAEVKTFIHDYLFSDKTGLPADSYTFEEVDEKTTAIFTHVFQQHSDSTYNAHAN